MSEEVVICTPADIIMVQKYMYFDDKEGQTVCVGSAGRAQYVLSIVAHKFGRKFPLAHELPVTVVDKLSELKQKADMPESGLGTTDIYEKVCGIMSKSGIAYRERQ